MKIKLIIGFLLATLLVVFAIQNAEVVSVKFMFWKLEVSRALLILLSMAIGAIFTIILSMSFPKKKKVVDKQNTKVESTSNEHGR